MVTRQIRPSERGSALILTVLILFAMLGLGMLAMRSATQNVSGSGNMRLSMQARHIAEMGLFHAVTLMNRQAGILLPLREGRGLEESVIEVQSPLVAAGGRRSRVAVKNAAGNTVSERQIAAPPFFVEGPPVLGVAGTASGLKPSYAVTVSGFQPWTCPPGFDEEALRRNGQGCCLMHFESNAVIAASETPEADALNTREAADLFAEHAMRAGVVMGPFSIRGCSR